MNSIIIILIITLLTTQADEFPNLNQSTKVIAGSYGINETLTVDFNTEYIVRFKESSAINPYTVYAWSQQIFYDHPVFIVVRQQTEILSWELPLPVESHSGTSKFTHISRTLCHANMDLIAELPRNITHNNEVQVKNISGMHKHLTMSISTASKIPTTVVIRVEEENNFYITENQNYTVTVSPSEPKFFYYKFVDDAEDDTSAIIVEIVSYDSVCLTVAVQNATCPVIDLNNKDMWFKGKHQTVEGKGGIIIKRWEFPKGFFLQLAAKGDNYECSRELSTIPQYRTDIVRPLNRSSVVSFVLRTSISRDDYLIASLTTLGVIAIFYLTFIITMWGCYRYAEVFTTAGHSVDNLDKAYTDDEFIHMAVDDIDARLATVDLKLSDLAKNDEEYYERKSSNYLWHVVSIAIFYGIPVIQLVISYQRVVNITGNQDICYYNFLCAHPLIGFSDFNHIFSNIGYVLTGILFLIITFSRNRRVVCLDRHGIPKHYGLFYAMGVALIMEGVLSACYHICPNQTNFQFDTSFMYVMATLCMVKLYQNRHPDINATAYATFMVLGFAIFAAMVGVLNGHIILWIIFIIVYIVLCVYVSFNIYFLSYIKKGVMSVVHDWNEDHSVIDALKPKRRAHFILLLIVNVLNIVLSCLGILCYFSGTDFATFLLGLLMGNAILYAIIYIIMKAIHHEKICLHTAVFGILGLFTWIGATYFFYNNSTLWTVTPAESREWNTHCILMGFYDHHDIWHLLSASALFFSFMLLLTLDDDLLNVPHKKIAVF